MNRSLLSILFVLSLFVVSCGEEKEGESTDVEGCPDLTVLFSQVEDIRNKQWGNPFSWEAVLPVWNSFLENLSANESGSNEKCSFIDHRVGPQYDRFMIFGVLSQKIIETKNPEPISILLKVRNIYEDDEEISEFFGEELMDIALRGTETYLQYYNSKPQLQKKLVEATVWEESSREELFKNLDQLQGSEKLSTLLKNRFAALDA